METELYKVYVKTDTAGHVIAVNSSEFMAGVEGWVQIDEGAGDKYHHAQSNYLPGVVTDDAGAHNYILDGETIREATEEEKQAERAASQTPEAKPSQTADEQLAELAAAIERGLTT